MNIRFVPREEIDKQLYNSCVHYATNGNVFGYDWFLDNTAREWDALVEDDNYTSVMPLPRRKNWLGRQYLFHPRLVSDLGVYSVNVLSPKRIQSFWEAIPEVYRGGELTVEPASVPPKGSRFEVSAASGDALFLNRPYEELVDDFPSDYFRRLALAEAADLIPATPTKPEKLADFWLAQHGKGGDNEWRYHAMQRLMYQVLHRGWGNAFVVQTKEKEILAGIFLIYSHNRIFPLFGAESPAGAAVGAGTWLRDNLLHSHAERSLKIDKGELFVH